MVGSITSRLSSFAFCIATCLHLRLKHSSIPLVFRGNARYLYKSPMVNIGNNVHIGPRPHLSVIEGGRLTIGHGTVIGSDFVLSCSGSVDIGSNVLFADRCFVADSGHAYADARVPIKSQGMTTGRVTIADDCWIGINVSILPDVTIGKHAIIGANSVVTQDIPAYSVACGVPACVVKTYDEKLDQWIPVVS